MRLSNRNKSIDYTNDPVKDKSFLGKVIHRTSRQNSEKRRSRSVSSLHRSYQEVNVNYNDNEPPTPRTQYPNNNGPIPRPVRPSMLPLASSPACIRPTNRYFVTPLRNVARCFTFYEYILSLPKNASPLHHIDLMMIMRLIFNLSLN